jgi:hypothetical protein
MTPVNQSTLQQIDQFRHGLSHSIVQGLLGLFGSISIYQEDVELLPCGYRWVQQVFVQPPAFYHQAAYAVAFYAEAPFLFRHGKARPYRRGLIGVAWQRMVNEFYRKNRKRFPGTEKRLNMLLALKPLVCFESITNGANILRLTNYLRRRSSETVSL